MSKQLAPVPPGYSKFLGELKERIRSAQHRAVLSVNRELVLLYWRIGRDILKRQSEAGWGTGVIERLAIDLRRAFPEMKGLSRTNLLYMRKFAESWPQETKVQQLVGQIPWGHNIRILDKVRNAAEREWYIRATIKHGWSRNVLVHQIDSDLHRRQGMAVTNFQKTLPARQSELAKEVLKDPYNFDFLSLSREVGERELHQGLLEHLREFL